MKDDFNGVGEDWENKVYGRFKKEGLSCLVLDNNKARKGRCVDCYVYKKGIESKGFLCEIKSINSAGFDPFIKGYISTRNQNFNNATSVDSLNDAVNQRKKYEYDYDHDGFVLKIEEVLSDALIQYNESDLSSFNISKSKKPFIVALYFDFVFFPDQVNFIQLLEQFPAISAVLTLERDFAREKIKQEHLQELNKLLKNRQIHLIKDIAKKWESDYGGTQDTVNFRIYRNGLASNVFQPNYFFPHFVE